MTDGDRRVSLAILDGTFNRLRDPLHVVACWSLGGSAFAFDRKYIARSQQAEFRRFAQVRAANPMAPVALFGHTDVAGKITYNHELSWGRAEAVYGVLVNEPDIWITLYKDDREELDHLKQRFVADGYDIDPKEKGLGATTTAAIAAHLSHLAGDLKLDPYDFLGEHGQYSMQACSEFNPLRRLSRSLADKLTPEQRAAAERTNRRVVAFFFEPGTHVDGWWPCPKPGTGPAKCGARLWSNAKTRRSTDDPSREFFPKGAKGKPFAPIVRAHDTFECRFYERIAFDSPCERAEVWKPPKDPDPPPPPPPTEIDPDPPIEDPAVWVLLARCPHDDHKNSGFLGKSGPDGHDAIQIVPDEFGEVVRFFTVPPVEVSWSLDGTPSSGSSAAKSIPRVDAGSPSFRELLEWSPEVHLVQAIKDGAQHALQVHAFPDATWKFDLEGIRSKIRDEAFNIQLLIWKQVLDVATEKHELRFLEKGDCDGVIGLQWQESPGRSGAGADWQAFASFFFRVRAEPLFRLGATMELSLAKLLQKLKKIPGAKEVIEEIEKRFPKLLKVLDSLKLTGEFEADGGGVSKVVVDRPGKPIPNIGVNDDPSARKLEIDGAFTWAGSFAATGEDIAKALEDVGVWISVELGMKATVGFVLDLDRDEVGAYVDAKFEGLRVGLRAGLGFRDLEWEGDVIDAKDLGRVQVTASLP